MKRAAVWSAAVVVVQLALLPVFASAPAKEGSALDAVRTAYQPSDVPLLDRRGQVIHELRLDRTRRRLAWTRLADVSPALVRAVIESEDRRFFKHGGVDWRALAVAFIERVAGGPARGASTITMQLAALLEPSLRRSGAPRSLRQKWQQMRAAWRIEQGWSKDEILEAYLNLLTFRGELQGVAAATNVLFGKVPHGITVAEALVLGVLPRAPNADRAAVARRAWRLRGPGQGPTGAEIDQAVARALDTPAGGGPRLALAPHVAHQLLAGSIAPVQSTLDADVQRVVRDALRRQLVDLRSRRVQDGAVLVVDNASGDVLAYAGSGDDLSSARFVDGVRMRRQAGSVLKPFLYGLALERRLLTAASLIEDTPLELPVTGGLYRPQNYDQQFRGAVSLRTALAASLNIPAVRTLQLIGAEPYVEHLRRLGFAGLKSGTFYGPSLALGSADVSLWEIVAAYRAVANGGRWSALRLRAAAPRASELRVYSEATAFLVADILADRESRSVTFGLENPLATRFWSAVKTGTSKDMRDNWCVGFSRNYTVGVWVGNFSGEPMRDVSGVSGAAPLWLDVMEWLHQRAPAPPPDAPAGVVGQAVTFPARTEPARAEWFARGTEPAAGAQLRARNRPRIVSPVGGAIIAVDPDIPAPLQRVVFEAREPGGARWVLDGSVLGGADLRLWSPQPGQHTLALVDAGQHVLDRVTFAVRGRVSEEGIYRMSRILHRPNRHRMSVRPIRICGRIRRPGR